MVNKTLVDILTAKKMRVATAESCTGGMIGMQITAVPGSSEVYDGGVISYSNEIKQKVLGVPAATLENFGAVSEQTARAMAEGVLKLFSTDCSVAVTGIAGPGGGTQEKPVGLVWIAVERGGIIKTEKCHFYGGRQQIREQTAERAMQLLIDIVRA